MQQQPTRVIALSLFNELKRRNVFRIGAAYVVGAWLLIQVTETIFPLFGFDDTPARLVVIALAIGFIPSLIFSWVFEVTPEGLKKDADIDYEKSISQTTGRNLDRVTLVVLALALGYFAFDKFVLDPVEDEQIAQSARREGRTTALTESYGDKSIAVLPFANMSSDPEQEYFSDGITEEILNLLVRIPELRVTSRTSVFSFKGQNLDIPTVAKKLGVAHILEGSVRRAGDRVRITAQLIEAANDVHLWSETYERGLDDIFAIQDEIAGDVVKSLQIQLLGDAPLAVSTNIDAYKLYLRGKHFYALGTNESLGSSEKAYREAIALDANFAPPWVGLADVLRVQGFHGLIEMQEAMEASRRAAMRALELDSKMAEGWVSLADIQYYWDWDWASAEVSTLTALGLGPRDARVLRQAAWVALTLGETERALELAKRGVDLDPFEFSGLTRLASIYWALGQPKEEEQIYRHILELYPEADDIKPYLAAALAAQGRPEESLQYLILDAEGRWQKSMSAIVLHSVGRHEEERQMQQYLIDEGSDRWANTIAMNFAWHGDLDSAFEWLNIAYDQRDTYMSNLIFNPWMANLHDDPRWEKILDRMGLLPYWIKTQAKTENIES
jgi:TolB-like protein